MYNYKIYRLQRITTWIRTSLLSTPTPHLKVNHCTLLTLTDKKSGLPTYSFTCQQTLRHSAFKHAFFIWWHITYLNTWFLPLSFGSSNVSVSLSALVVTSCSVALPQHQRRQYRLLPRVQPRCLVVKQSPYCGSRHCFQKASWVCHVLAEHDCKTCRTWMWLLRRGLCFVRRRQAGSRGHAVSLSGSLSHTPTLLIGGTECSWHEWNICRRQKRSKCCGDTHSNGQNCQTTVPFTAHTHRNCPLHLGP